MFWVKFGVKKHEKKGTKLFEPAGQVQFVVFENLRVLLNAKLQEKSCYYLLIKYMKKHHSKF